MAPLWQLHFDIDRYVDPIIPAPPWEAVPYPISYLLGHRRFPAEKKYGNVLLTLRALFGVFVSLVLIQLLSHQIPWAVAGGPRIVASFGAAAVLEFCAFESPFAQPRNFIVSQIIASVIGVSLSKLFQLRSNDDWVRWLGGALACAITTAVMDLTKTVHPPAGATALIAVIDDSAQSIGWKFIPLVLLGCSIMLSVALISNNIFTRFPVYWWTANDLAAFPTKRLSDPSIGDEEAAAKAQSGEIIILPGGEVVLPEHIRLSPEEKRLLEQISSILMAFSYRWAVSGRIPIVFNSIQLHTHKTEERRNANSVKLRSAYILPANNTRENINMSNDFLDPGQRRFEASQAEAWRNIRQHQRQVEDAASRLKAISIEAQAPLESKPPHSRPLSLFERLPEEVLIAIMEYLDYESLYRLSQTTRYFLRLSFDIAFESDPSWRTFRHTVDSLSNGPRRRVVDWVRREP
ncbi:hypothetical protein CHU98_g5772 [Xylaria longipes]|nr:hypothetical protein CHU98_g5772 [Xylaria longipes]